MKSLKRILKMTGTLACVLFLVAVCAFFACAEGGDSDPEPEMVRSETIINLMYPDGSEEEYSYGHNDVTFSVVIGNETVATDVTYWSDDVPEGTTVRITSIHAENSLYVEPQLTISKTVYENDNQIEIPVYAPSYIQVQPVANLNGPDNGTGDYYIYNVYINGVLEKENVWGHTDFYVPYLGSWEIRDVRTPADNGTDGYTTSYSLSYTEDWTDREIDLSLPPLVDKVDVNVMTDETHEWWDGIDECTFDVLANGTKIADDVHDFNAMLPLGATVTVNDIRLTDPCLALRASGAITKTLTVTDDTKIWVNLVSHRWSAASATPGSDGNDGEIVYTCSVCGETKTCSFTDSGASFEAFIGDQWGDYFTALTNNDGAFSALPYDGEALTRWRFERLSDGSYRILSAADGLALTVLNTVADNYRGLGLTLAEPDGSPAQSFWLHCSDHDSYWYAIYSTLSPDSVFCSQDYDTPSLSGSEGWWQLRVIEDLGDDFLGELRFSYDLNKAASALGSNVEIADFDGGAAQRWRFVRQQNGAYKITNEAKGLVMTAEPAEDAESPWRNTGLAAANGSADQLWYIFRQPGYGRAKYYLQPAGAGGVLDLTNGDMTSGTTIGVWELHGGYQEQWSVLRYVDLGSDASSEWQVVNAVVGKPLTGSDSLIQGDYTDTDAWRFVKLENGAYTISDSSGNRFWTVENGGALNSDVILAAYTGASNQQWFIYEDYYNDYEAYERHGYVFLRPACAVTVLDLLFCDTTTGTNVEVFEMHGGDAEQWLLLTDAGISAVSCAEILANEKDAALTNDAGYNYEPMRFEPYTGADDQLWFLEPQTNGNIMIRSGQFGEYWTLTDESSVELAAADAGAEQEWRIFRDPDGAYYIRAADGPFVMNSDIRLRVSDTNEAKYHRFTFNEYGVLGSVSLSAATVTYNGSVRSPSVTVKDTRGQTLKQGTDYILTVPGGRKNAGTYTYTAAGKGFYRGTLSADLVIRKQALSASRITLSWTDNEYNGEVLKPAVTVKNAAGVTLTEGTSYTLTWSGDSKLPGTYTVTVKGNGNFSGSVPMTYTVSKQALSASRITLSWTSKPYNSAEQKPTVTVKNAAGLTLTEGTSYTLTWSGDSKLPGTYTVTVNAKGDKYSGSVPMTYTIGKQPLDASRVTLSWTSKVYNGEVQKPTVTVKNSKGLTLTEGTSYTLTWSGESKTPGTYTVTVKAKGDKYSGSVPKTYTITKQPIDASRVTLSWTSKVYNGDVQKPTVTVKNSKGLTLTEGTSYTLTWSGESKTPGTYTVTVKAKGDK
nr:RICIN domain-containing protein [Clostridia bacterium]